MRDVPLVLRESRQILVRTGFGRRFRRKLNGFLDEVFGKEGRGVFCESDKLRELLAERRLEIVLVFCDGRSFCDCRVMRKPTRLRLEFVGLRGRNGNFDERLWGRGGTIISWGVKKIEDLAKMRSIPRA